MTTIRLEAVEYYKERFQDEEIKFTNTLKWLDSLSGQHVPRFFSIDDEHIENVRNLLDTMGLKYTVMPGWYLSDAPYENLLRMVKHNPCIMYLDVVDELPHKMHNSLMKASASSDKPCSSLDFEDTMDVIEFVQACVERHFDDINETIAKKRIEMLKTMEVPS